MSPHTDERYWAEYDGLQLAKHRILTRYLGGWFPILASRNGRVLYIDCHAGRGRHLTGHEGSPILALRLLLRHSHRDRILSHTNVSFVFFENNRVNYEALLAEIGSLGSLPTRIEVHPFPSDYEAELRNSIYELRSRQLQFAPTFAFVDPYGFTLSMQLLNDLLQFPQCELLINFMYRYVVMAVQNPPHEANLDALFGTPTWRRLRSIDDPERRVDETIRLFSSQLQARFVTHMHMRGDNGALKYVLFHATNHRKGRLLMKDAMWAVAQDGSFTANERHSPDQLVLIVPEPDLEPLKQSMWQEFAGREVSMEQIHDWLLNESYLDKHIHQVLRDYRDRGIVQFTGYEGRFAFGSNPRAQFPQERPPGS